MNKKLESKLFQLRLKRYDEKKTRFLLKFYDKKDVQKFLGKRRLYWKYGIPMTL